MMDTVTLVVITAVVHAVGRLVETAAQALMLVGFARAVRAAAQLPPGTEVIIRTPAGTHLQMRIAVPRAVTR